MNLPKAIEILVARISCEEEGNPRDVYNATKLGIEALKREQILRREIPYDREGLLPGETEE